MTSPGQPMQPDAEVRALTTPPGGIMTREVGAITGDVEIWIGPTHPDQLAIRYTGALDTYAVVGALAGRDLDHAAEALTFDPGTDDTGNPLPVDLNTQQQLNQP